VKRDLEEELYARFLEELEERSFDGDELWARGPGGSDAKDTTTDVKGQLPNDNPTPVGSGAGSDPAPTPASQGVPPSNEKKEKKKR
jgi:hypothetical protein